MKTTNTPRQYRTADEWRTAIQQWYQSGLSAPKFCKANGLGYASFCQWRKRLQVQEAQVSVLDKNEFIDLSDLASQPAGKTAHRTLFLRMGNWFELQIGH